MAQVVALVRRGMVLEIYAIAVIDEGIEIKTPARWTGLI
jgi:hypothetical protein